MFKFSSLSLFILVGLLCVEAQTSTCSDLFQSVGGRLSIASRLATKQSVDKTVVAFHGTGEHALRELRRTGFLPPGDVKRDSLPLELNMKPNLYVTEVAEFSPTNIQTYAGKFGADTLGAMKVEEAFDEAAVYAKIASLWREAFPKRFGIPINAQTRNYIFGVEDKEDFVFKELKARFKVSRLDAIRAFNEIKRVFDSDRAGGVVLALDSALYRDFELCRCGDDGLRVHLPPEGLALKYIKQIIPLSPEAQRIVLGEDPK